MVPKIYSKRGCLTCKTRRKKCDEARPTCRACIRLNLSCSYDTKVVAQSRARISASSAPEQDSNNIRQAPHSGTDKSISSMHREHVSYRLLEGLDYAAFQLSICESFVVNVCEQGWNHDLAEADKLSNVTIRASLPLTSSNELSASRTAWHAYCYYIFGKEHHLSPMLMHSRSLYSDVLTILYSLKWDGQSVETGMEIVMAASFLTMLEMRASINPKAWVVHNEGVLAIITRLGPRAFTDPQRLSWFESARWGFIFASIIQNKLTKLEDNAWLTIPWSRLGMHGWEQHKPMEQQMLDIILSGRKRLRGLLTLKSAPDKTSVKQIISSFWLDYCEMVQSANDWQNRHSSRIKVTDWLVYADCACERKLFMHGVPLFATPIATVSVSWYYIMLNHLNAVAAFVCVLMAEMDISSDVFELEPIVHCSWIDDPEIEHDVLTYMHDPNSRDFISDVSSTNHSKVLWLAMADRLLNLSHEAARMECSVIAPLTEGQERSFVSILAMIALVPAIHVLGDDPLSLWAQRKCLTLLGGQAFEEIMEMTKNINMVDM